VLRRCAILNMATKSRELAVVVSLLLVSVTVSLAQEFSCTSRKTCKQMRSCGEAVCRFRQCGDRERDGDNDGIPCEAICGKTHAEMKRRLDGGL